MMIYDDVETYLGTSSTKQIDVRFPRYSTSKDEFIDSDHFRIQNCIIQLFQLHSCWRQEFVHAQLMAVMATRVVKFLNFRYIMKYGIMIARFAPDLQLPYIDYSLNGTITVY
jgi:hypothetical protein